MNLIHIPRRLTDVSVRARRPFRIALRLANGEAPSEIPAFFARSRLYWRKFLERRGNHRIPASFQHTHFLIHFSQRLDLHFTWQPMVIRERQPAGFVARSVARPEPFLSHPALLHRQSAMAAAPFSSGNAIADPLGRQEMAASSPSPMVLRRDNRSLDQPDTSFIKAVLQRQTDRPDSVQPWEEGRGSKTLSWPQRTPMDRRSEAGSRFSLRRPTAQDQPWPQRMVMGLPSGAGLGFRLRRASAPDRLEPAPITDNGFFRPTGAKRIDLGADSVALRLATRERSDPSSQAPSLAPVRLVWRESVPGDDAHPLAATANRRDWAFSERPLGSTATEHLEDPSEKLITQAREAARRELLSGSTVERLADDVMRRLEKRMRIERERRGL